ALVSKSQSIRQRATGDQYEVAPQRAPRDQPAQLSAGYPAQSALVSLLLTSRHHRLPSESYGCSQELATLIKHNSVGHRVRVMTSDQKHPSRLSHSTRQLPCGAATFRRQARLGADPSLIVGIAHVSGGRFSMETTHPERTDFEFLEEAHDFSLVLG